VYPYFFSLHIGSVVFISNDVGFAYHIIRAIQSLVSSDGKIPRLFLCNEEVEY
jgi:hypothetical protein